jgi:hypothetical protein
VDHFSLPSFNLKNNEEKGLLDETINQEIHGTISQFEWAFAM